jgi:hypothetical protein
VHTGAWHRRQWASDRSGRRHRRRHRSRRRHR